MKAIASKRNLVMALTILFVGAFGGAGNSLADLQDGLLAYWTFDEGSGGTLHDYWGGHDGTIFGDPQWVEGIGISGYALEFDGNGDYVEITEQIEDFAFANQ